MRHPGARAGVDGAAASVPLPYIEGRGHEAAQHHRAAALRHEAAGLPATLDGAEAARIRANLAELEAESA